MIVLNDTDNRLTLTQQHCACLSRSITNVTCCLLSQAEDAGLKVDDVIVEIDGRDVLNASHDRVIQLLQSNKQSVMVAVVYVPTWLLLQSNCLSCTHTTRVRRGLLAGGRKESVVEGVATNYRRLCGRP
jgi:hypothetical protein